MLECARENRLLILIAAACAAMSAALGEPARGANYGVPHGGLSLLQTSTVQRQARQPIARPRAVAPRRVQPKMSHGPVVRSHTPGHPTQAQRGPGSRAHDTAESQRKKAEAFNRARAEAKQLAEKQKHEAEARKHAEDEKRQAEAKQLAERQKHEAEALKRKQVAATLPVQPLNRKFANIATMPAAPADAPKPNQPANPQSSSELAQKIAIAIIMDLLGLGLEPVEPPVSPGPPELKQAPETPAQTSTIPGPDVSDADPQDTPSKRVRKRRPPEDLPPSDQLAEAPQDGTGAASTAANEARAAAEAAERARVEAASKIAKAKEAKRALGPDSLPTDIQVQKQLAEDAKTAYGNYLFAKQKADEAQQRATGTQQPPRAAEAQQSADAGVFSEAVKAWKTAQLAAERAVKQVAAEQHAAEVALADAKHEAYLARRERDRLDNEYQQKVADLAFNKYKGDENKAKEQLQKEADELKKANDRLAKAEKLMKVAGQQGGIGGALGNAVGRRIQNEEAMGEK